jgi:hypothetical protein
MRTREHDTAEKMQNSEQSRDRHTQRTDTGRAALQLPGMSRDRHRPAFQFYRHALCFLRCYRRRENVIKPVEESSLIKWR